MLAERMIAGLPEIDGEPDTAYLPAALRAPAAADLAWYTV